MVGCRRETDAVDSCSVIVLLFRVKNIHVLRGKNSHRLVVFIDDGSSLLQVEYSRVVFSRLHVLGRSEVVYVLEVEFTKFDTRVKWSSRVGRVIELGFLID